MIALAFSDIHGQYGRVSQIIRHEKTCDLIILAGDLTTQGSVADAEQALRSFLNLNIPLIGVAGNMDSPEIDEMFTRTGIGIDGRGIRLGDVGFCGVSGSPLSPLHTPYERGEEILLQTAEKGWADLRDVGKKIFVPHSPPMRTQLDRITPGMHVGSTAVRTFIENRQPDAVICGHIHESRGKDTLGRTIMINCGPASKGYYARLQMEETIIAENCG